MSTQEQAAGQAAAATAQERNLFDEIVEKGFGATPERDRPAEMVKALVDEAMQGTMTWDRNVSRTINHAIAKLDAALSKQLAAIMHHPSFQKLEGTWRGLHYLVHNSETSAQLKIKVLNA